MKTTLIALALLAAGIVPPASARQAPHHPSNAANAHAQMTAPKPIVDRTQGPRTGSDGRLHDPDMDWEIRSEEMHGLW